MEPEEDGDFVTLSCGIEQRHLGLGCWTAEITVHTLETSHLPALCLGSPAPLSPSLQSQDLESLPPNPAKGNLDSKAGLELGFLAEQSSRSQNKAVAVGDGEEASIDSAAFLKVGQLVNKCVEVCGHGMFCAASASFHSLAVAGQARALTLRAPNAKTAGYILP